MQALDELTKNKHLSNGVKLIQMHRENMGILQQNYLDQLQELISELPNIGNVNFDLKKAALQDPVLDKLEDLQRKAMYQGFPEIKKLCSLAIGKRLLNIQIKKKKDDFYQRKIRKEEMESYFRENRIKKFDYHSLVREKILENIFILQPYPNGNGFIESTLYYEQYPSLLAESNYLEVIKQVNQLFFVEETSPHEQIECWWVLWRLLWTLVLALIVMMVTYQFWSFSKEQYVLLVLILVILGIVVYLSLKNFWLKPNDLNRQEHIMEATKQYFHKLNMQFIQKGKAIQWHCPQSFMYLQVQFNDDFAANSP